MTGMTVVVLSFYSIALCGERFMLLGPSIGRNAKLVVPYFLVIADASGSGTPYAADSGLGTDT